MKLPWPKPRQPKPDPRAIAAGLAALPASDRARLGQLLTAPAGRSDLVVTDSAVLKLNERVPSLSAWRIPEPAPGVVPPGQKTVAMAMDGALSAYTSTGAAYNWAMQGLWNEGLGFLGYPYLAELTQRPEYRRISEIIAKEMTRKWVTITSSGDGDKTDRIAKLEAAMKKYRVQSLFRQAAQMDGFFGRAQIFIDLGAGANREELAKPVILDPGKIDKGSLKALRILEPVWSYPGLFNASDPLGPDFYNPTQWYVMGQEVHISRLMTFVGREMPDFLKPAYQFGGLSLSQMAKPYVDNWLRTRQSVSDLIQAFSVMVLSTDMSTVLQGGTADNLLRRLQIFNQTRDNRGVFAVNKDSEELTNVSAPLGTLDHLQAQAQEHMASVSGIPLVVLLGITPSGLNASSDGEIKTFYAWIMAQQEHLFRPNLKYVMDVIQLSEFGDIDPDIDFTFNDLWEIPEDAKSQKRKTDAEVDQIYVNTGAISPDEVRTRLTEDDESPYHGLTGAAPGPPADPAAEEDPFGDGGEDDEDPDDDKPPPAQDGAPEFKEGDHPRAPDGKFGSGNGGASSGGEGLSRIKALMAETRTRKTKAKEIAAAGKSMVFEHTNGARTMIAPDLSAPGTWRMTRVDASGEPFGHVENVDPVDAVFETLNSGATLKGTPGGGAAALPFSPEELAAAPSPKAVRQPVNTWEDIQAKGAEAHKDFSAGLAAVGDQLGLKTDVLAPEKLTDAQAATEDGYLFIAPNKSEARAKEKVKHDYASEEHPDGDWSKLKDYVRGTIAVRSPAEVTKAIEAVKAQGWKLAAKPKDNFSKPTEAGYRDVNTLWEMPNGMLAELQFNTKAMIVAKEKLHGEGGYEEMQKLARKNGTDGPTDTWSDQDREKWDQVIGAQQRAYSAAWAASGGGTA